MEKRSDQNKKPPRKVRKATISFELYRWPFQRLLTKHREIILALILSTIVGIYIVPLFLK